MVARVFSWLNRSFLINSSVNNNMRMFLCLAILFLPASFATAQSSSPGTSAVRIEVPPANGFTRVLRPYKARTVPPINLANSSRLELLIRAGNLYLTADDVVALALENNIDIEVQRYSPLLAREVLRRAQGGGLLRSVGLNVAPGPVSVSLAGVTINTNGAPTSAEGSGVSSGGGIVTQLGPSIPSFDPVISGFANFQHLTIPQSNTQLTGTTTLIDNVRSFQFAYSQNWSFGMSAFLNYSSARNSINSAFYSLNPYTSGALDLQVTQNLLNGFGSAVNGRNILVQKNNLKVTDLQFKQQVITTVTAVLNLYWDLVSFDQDVKAREEAVATAQQLLQNNQEQVKIGALAELEITRAQSQLFAARQDLVIAQTNSLQQQTILKNALSRAGVATSELAEVRVIPLDTIQIPAKDEIAPANELVPEALRNRVEIEQASINLASNRLNLVGIKNSLKPTLQVFAELTNNGLTGDITPFGLALGGLPELTGGYGNLLAQIARRNFPNYSAGLSFNIPLRNRAAQADYVTSEVEIRQNELSLQKQINQVRVDVQNAVIGLQQARVRYDAAVQGRILAQETFDGDKKRYELGSSTPYQVVQDQRDLASAQSSEVQALANYSHARLAFEQALGTTLTVHHISLDEAMAGKIKAPPSQIPEAGK